MDRQLEKRRILPRGKWMLIFFVVFLQNSGQRKFPILHCYEPEALTVAISIGFQSYIFPYCSYDDSSITYTWMRVLAHAYAHGHLIV
jgi:hypothetical protein